ncbi:MAG TPA: hypothetical protein VJU18_12175 [Vicinamibacteria bacterium]|nr:hypothetical protein [Vicinamibacteria bacterium]
MDLRGILTRYAELAPGAVPGAVALTLALVLVAAAGRRLARREPRLARWGPVLLVLFAILVGLSRAWSRLWLADDAFISFRYAQNLLAGHGLVFNVGERVEGYTNFLWTMLLAALMKLSVRAEHAAIALGIASYLGAVLATARVRRAILPEGGALPGAHLFLAVQGLFATYATSGLETMMCTALVLAGAACRFGLGGSRGLLLASTCLTLATLGRPDHVLFYAALGIELVTTASRAGGGGAQGLARVLRTERRSLAFYLAPMLLLYLPYFAWRFNYYGFLLPNTFYVKSGGGAYYSQGLTYVLVFLLATHFWLLLPWVVRGVGRGMRSPRAHGFVLFALTSLVLYGGYVIRVGGDFMYGRFLVVLVPLWLLLAELGTDRGSDAERLMPTGPWAEARRAALALLPFAVVAFDTVLQRPGEVRWGIADEPSFYPVPSWRHPEPRSRFTVLGRDLDRLVTSQGVEPRLGLGSIGIAGFYSRLPVLDLMGLTDTQVAHQPVGPRARPGHEKEASDDYVLSRPVHFALTKREFHPAEYRPLTRVRVGPSELAIVVYDREIMRRLAAQPEVAFVDFEQYLDRYLETLGQRGRPGVAKDFRFFRRYYFDHNQDPDREGALRTFLANTKRE